MDYLECQNGEHCKLDYKDGQCHKCEHVHDCQQHWSYCDYCYCCDCKLKQEDYTWDGSGD